MTMYSKQTLLLLEGLVKIDTYKRPEHCPWMHIHLLVKRINAVVECLKRVSVNCGNCETKLEFCEASSLAVAGREATCSLLVLWS